MSLTDTSQAIDREPLLDICCICAKPHRGRYGDQHEFAPAELMPVSAAIILANLRGDVLPRHEFSSAELEDFMARKHDPSWTAPKPPRTKLTPPRLPKRAPGRPGIGATINHPTYGMAVLIGQGDGRSWHAQSTTDPSKLFTVLISDSFDRAMLTD